VDWKKVYPEKPFYLFTFQDRSLFIEYRKYWVINEISQSIQLELLLDRMLKLLHFL